MRKEEISKLSQNELHDKLNKLMGLLGRDNTVNPIALESEKTRDFAIESIENGFEVYLENRVNALKDLSKELKDQKDLHSDIANDLKFIYEKARKLRFKEERIFEINDVLVNIQSPFLRFNNVEKVNTIFSGIKILNDVRSKVEKELASTWITDTEISPSVYIPNSFSINHPDCENTFECPDYPKRHQYVFSKKIDDNGNEWLYYEDKGVINNSEEIHELDIDTIYEIFRVLLRSDVEEYFNQLLEYNDQSYIVKKAISEIIRYMSNPNNTFEEREKYINCTGVCLIHYVQLNKNYLLSLGDFTRTLYDLFKIL